MALNFAHGSLAWNSADAVATNYLVSGLSFKPKFLFFLINGQPDSTNTASQTGTGRVCEGFASSPSSRRCMGFLDTDAAASATTAEVYRDDAVLATVSAAGAADGLLDLTAINDDGFQLTVDDTAPVNLRVFWFAWGGSDITGVQIGEILEPAATGNVDYTGPGFPPDVVFFAGCQLTAAAPTAAVTDAGLMFGAATGAGSKHQFVLAGNSDEGSANMDTDSYYRLDECLASIPLAGGDPVARANFVQFLTNGFRLNWSERATTNRRYMYAAIQGGLWRVDAFDIDLFTTGNTTTVVTTAENGQTFQPVGAFHVSRQGLESPVDTSAPVSRLIFGAWSGLTDRRSIGYYSENSTATAEVDLSIWYDEVIAHVGAVGTITTEVDIDAINANGFRAIVDLGIGLGVPPVTDTQAFIAFGSNPSPEPSFQGNTHPFRRKLRENAKAALVAAGLLLYQHPDVTGQSAAAEPSTVVQEVQGTRSLGEHSQRYKKRVGAANQLLWRGAHESREEEAPWSPPVPSADTALRRSLDSLRSQARRAAPYGWFTPSDDSFETEPWLQPVPGSETGLGRALSRLRVLANRAAPYGWFTPKDYSLEAEPPVQDVPGASTALRRSAQRLFDRALTAARYGWFTPEDTTTETEPWVQDVQGTRSLGQSLKALTTRAVRAAVYGWFSSAETFNQHDPTQPIQGTDALARAAARLRATAIKAAQLGWFQPEDESTEEFTWTQPVPGTAALSTAQRAASFRAIQAAQYGWFTPEDFDAAVPDWVQPVPGTRSLSASAGRYRTTAITASRYLWTVPTDTFEESTWTQDVQGTASLRAQARAFTRRALVAAGLGWFTPSDDSHFDEPWLQAIQGTAQLRAAARAAWQRARTAADYGWFGSADANAEDAPPVQPVQGTSSLQREWSARWARAVIAARYLWFTPEDETTEPDTWTQDVQGVQLLRLAADRYRRRAVIAWQLFWTHGTDASVEAEPPVQDVQGTSSLARLAREARARAIAAARYTWFQPEDDTTDTGTTELYIQPVQGTGALRRVAIEFRNRARALRALMVWYGFEDAPPPPPPVICEFTTVLRRQEAIVVTVDRLISYDLGVRTDAEPLDTIVDDETRLLDVIVGIGTGLDVVLGVGVLDVTVTVTRQEAIVAEVVQSDAVDLSVPLAPAAVVVVDTSLNRVFEFILDIETRMDVELHVEC